MKEYNVIKRYELISQKNPEEDEERNEISDGSAYFDYNYLTIKSVHSKRKENK